MKHPRTRLRDGDDNEVVSWLKKPKLMSGVAAGGRSAHEEGCAADGQPAMSQLQPGEEVDGSDYSPVPSEDDEPPALLPLGAPLKLEEDDPALVFREEQTLVQYQQVLLELSLDDRIPTKLWAELHTRAMFESFRREEKARAEAAEAAEAAAAAVGAAAVGAAAVGAADEAEGLADAQGPVERRALKRRVDELERQLQAARGDLARADTAAAAIDARADNAAAATDAPDTAAAAMSAHEKRTEQLVQEAARLRAAETPAGRNAAVERSRQAAAAVERSRQAAAAAQPSPSISPMRRSWQLDAKNLAGEHYSVMLVPLTTTVAGLKEQIRASMTSRGRRSPEDMRLIFAGAELQPEDAVARATGPGQQLLPGSVIHIWDGPVPGRL